MVPGAHMNSSPQGPIQRPRGRRNPLLRSDFSGSGKTREQGAAEGREGAKSRVRPRPPLPKTRQHGAAPENAFTVAPESAQDVSTARSVPNNGGSGAAEPQAKKLILQGGLAPNCYPPQSTNCGSTSELMAGARQRGLPVNVSIKLTSSLAPASFRAAR